MKKKFISIFALAMIFSVGTTAQVDSTAHVRQKVMTLKECMEYAVDNSTKNKVQQLDNADARINKREAILKAFTPSISANTNTYYNFGRTVDPETNTYTNITSFSNGYSISAGITLFDGFSAINNIKISQTAIKIGISQEDKIRDELCLSVMEAYCNVMYHSEMVEVLKKKVETGKKNLELIKKQYDLGQKSYPDVVQTEADQADTEYQLINSTNNLNNAMLTLKSLMLWPTEKELNLDRSIINDSIPPYDDTEDAVSEIIDFAVNTQPDALIAKGELRSAKISLNTAKWQFLPTLSLSGGWSTSYYSYPGNDSYISPSFGSQWRNNAGEYVQLNLSIPIYDRLSRHSDLSRKKNAYRRAQAQYEQTKLDIEAEVTRAVQDKQGAMKAMIQAEKRADSQSETYKLHEKKMLLGLVSPVEFQTISNTYLNALAERLNARLQYFLKKSVVEYYKGISYLNQ